MQRLQAEGLVNLARTAAAFHEATAPIASRSPGQSAPDFGALAWQLEERWRNVASRRVTICWATSRAARLLGGLAPFERRATQLEHDLGTAGVLVRLHERQPELADQWVGEDILRRDFAPYCPSLKSIPDGALVSDGRIRPRDRIRRPIHGHATASVRRAFQSETRHPVRNLVVHHVQSEQEEACTAHANGNSSSWPRTVWSPWRSFIAPSSRMRKPKPPARPCDALSTADFCGRNRWMPSASTTDSPGEARG